MVALLLKVGRGERRAQRVLARIDPERGIVAHVLGGKALRRKIRNELLDPPWVHHGAGEDVVPDRGTLLDHEHGGRLDRIPALPLHALVVRLDLVHEMQGGSQRRRARPDEQDIHLHALACRRGHAHLHPRLRSIRA